MRILVDLVSMMKKATERHMNGKAEKITKKYIDICFRREYTI